MSDEITLDAPGLRLAVRTHGDDGAPPIVALHGWLDNAATFDRLAPLLPSHRFLAVDMAGHGFSQHRSPDASYDIINAVADLAHVVPEPCVLMGHSLGAAISVLFAGAFPERVSKLVLLEGLGPLTEPAESAPERLRSALADEKRKSRTRVFASVDEALDRVVSTMPMDRESARILLSRGLEEADGGYTWRTDSRLRAPSRLRLTEEHVAHFMKRATMPTFVVLADQGWPVPEEIVAQRLGYLPNKHVVRVAGTHHVHLDAPERFIDRLKSFLG